MADNSQVVPVPGNAMAGHREYMEAYLCNISANSKILSAEKHEQVVKFLKNKSISSAELGIPHDKMAKFRWWVAEKEFEVVQEPLMKVIDVLVTPVVKTKKEVSMPYIMFKDDEIIMLERRYVCINSLGGESELPNCGSI